MEVFGHGLGDKIIKNNAISKTIKVKLFNISILHNLIGVLDWKGAAQSYDAYTRMTDIDDRCVSVHAQLQQLFVDICSHNFGIAFIDNLCGQSKSFSLNKTLGKFTTSTAMNDFFDHSLKNEILHTVLRNCCDVIPSFIEYLASLMENIKPKLRGKVFNAVTHCYECTDNDKLDNILTESLNFMNGEKFVDVAMLFCSPTKTLMQVIKTSNGVSPECVELVRKLYESMAKNCERVVTWIRVSEAFETKEQREKVEENFRVKMTESANICGWGEECQVLLSKELNDRTWFTKKRKEKPTEEVDMDHDEQDFTNEIDKEMGPFVKLLTHVNATEENTDSVDSSGAFKKCLKKFLTSPFACVGLFKVVSDTICNGRAALKKKQKKELFDLVISTKVIEEHWCIPQALDDDFRRKELIRNCILDVVVSCVDSSNKFMKTFYDTVHPMKLLSVYSGSLSHIDQKLFYLLSVHQLYDVSVPVHDILLFGNAVNEHFRFEHSKPPVLWRPIIASQCFNLLIDERMMTTINHFPIDRQSPISVDNKLQLGQSHRSLYDPCFVLEWLSQLFAKNCPGQDFVIDESMELKVLFSKKIIHFLVACQSSQSDKIRLASRILLGKLVERLEDYDNVANELPMRMQIQMILYHLFNTINVEKCTENLRLPSVFANLYVRMLLLLNHPDKKMFSPLWEMIIFNESFDVKYVPEFLYMMYSDKEDYRTRQLWCLQLCADSVKDYADFVVLLNTKVLMNITALFAIVDQCAKTLILTLIQHCVTLPQVAESLRKSPGFITWLMCTLCNKREKENKHALEEIRNTFLKSLQGSKDVASLELVLSMN